MNPDPEEMPDEASKPSYSEEEPRCEASNALLPSRRRHWMDTRLRTRMRAGGSRLHYQQFDYSLTDTEGERSDVLLTSDQVNNNENITTTPPIDDTMPIHGIPISPLPAMDEIFSENGAVIGPEPDVPTSPMRTLIDSADASLVGTSAPLLTNSSLTAMLSNFPIWPQINHQSVPKTRDSVSKQSVPKPDTLPPPVTVDPATATENTPNQEERQSRRPRESKTTCISITRPPTKVFPGAPSKEDAPEADHLVHCMLAPVIRKQRKSIWNMLVEKQELNS